MAARVASTVAAAALLAGAGVAWADDAPSRPLPDLAVSGAAEAPAGGSRLLRALAERPGRAGIPPVPGDGAFAPEPCPRALLRRLLAGAADGADALTALAIEREMLTLCRERQEIVTALFEGEASLRELRESALGPAGPEENTAAAPPAPGVPAAASVPEGTPSPLRATLAAAAGTAAQAPAPPRYGWFSIIGTAGALRAGVTDGTGVWFVREGDPLPEGVTVASISGRPPGVRIAGPDGGAPLSWRALPGGGP